LDVGCGEGADAVWLAERGWQVTAVDISTVALSRAAAHAVERGVDRITWIQADLDAWVPETAGFDLVSVQFMQLPPERREPLFRRLAGWVAPGGTLLIVGHHPLDLETNAHRPPAPEVFFTAEDAATSLDPHEWRILVSAARPRASADRDGQPVTVHDTVLRAERLQ
jgi:SAM-dependent methyltransferase